MKRDGAGPLMLGGEWEDSLMGSSLRRSPKPPSPVALWKRKVVQSKCTPTYIHVCVHVWYVCVYMYLYMWK